MPRARVLLLFATSANTSTFSYHQAWPRHFQAASAFECTPVNVGDRRWPARLRALATISSWRGDLIVILHSVFSNAQLLDGRTFEAIRHRREPKAYFIGNEYTFDPGHPDVQRHTFNVAMDIVTNYNVDGINFDYIRYSGINDGYNPVTVARFNQRFGRTGQPDIDEDTTRVGLGLSWLPNKNWTVSATYDWDHIDSGDASRNQERDRYGVSARLTF